jgi:hypothetical protein
LAGHDGRLEAITVVPVPPDPGPDGADLRKASICSAADLREGVDVLGRRPAGRRAFVEFLWVKPPTARQRRGADVEDRPAAPTRG